MATIVTSARPIISAAAVDAVRAGFRIAFSRASAPDAPPKRANGRPSPTRAAAPAAARSARRRRTARARRAPARAAAGRRRRRGRTGRSRAAPARGRRSRAATPCGTGEPPGRESGALADGRDRRHLRRLHRRGDARDQGDDDAEQHRDDHRARLEDGARLRAGRGPSAASAEPAPWRARRRATSPSAEASMPIAKPSTSTERRTWRREAPSVRSVASSRVRWATVIDSVLKMTNAPTNSATAAEREQEVLDELRERRRCPWPLAFACSVAGLHLRVRGQQRLDLADERGRRDAPLRRDRDQVVALLPEQRLGRRHVEDRDRRAAERVDGAEGGDADDAVVLRRPLDGGADRVADLEGRTSALPKSITISWALCAQRPSFSVIGLSSRCAGRARTRRSGCRSSRAACRRGRSASRSRSCRSGRRSARRAARRRQRLDLREQRARGRWASRSARTDD